MKQKYMGNIWALAIHLMFAKRITGPVMMLFYQYFGLTFTQIGILSGIHWASNSLLQVYGGAFSDVYGRKNASMLYAFLGMITMLIFIYGHTFWHFAAANLIFGTSLAMGSGNASSFLYDTLRVLKIEDKFKKYKGKVIFPQKIFNGLVLLLLPYFYLQDIKLPFIFGFLFSFISFITALFLFKEPPKKKKNCHTQLNLAIKSSFIEIIKSKKLSSIIMVYSAYGAFILLLFEYFQPIIKISGTPLVYFGLIYMLSRFMEGFGSLLIHKFEKFSTKSLLIFDGLLILLALIGFGFFNNQALLIFILLTGLIDGAYSITVHSFINKNVSPKNRTTILSTASMVSSLAIGLSITLFGMISDIVGVTNMFRIAALVFIGLMTFGLTFQAYSKKTNKGVKLN